MIAHAGLATVRLLAVLLMWWAIAVIGLVVSGSALIGLSWAGVDTPGPMAGVIIAAAMLIPPTLAVPAHLALATMARRGRCVAQHGRGMALEPSVATPVGRCDGAVGNLHDPVLYIAAASGLECKGAISVSRKTLPSLASRTGR